jgi:deoxyxylulose-5-phosphate synthase
MVSSVKQELQFNLRNVIDSAIQHGVLNRRDHLALTAAMFSDTSLSSAERNLINRVFDFIRMGRVQLED